MKKKSAILLSGLLVSALLAGCQTDKPKEVKKKPEVLSNLEMDVDTSFKEILEFQKTTNELDKDFNHYSVGYDVVEGPETKEKSFFVDAVYPIDDNSENDLFVTISTNNFDITAGNDSYKKVILQDKSEAFLKTSNGKDLTWLKEKNILQLFSSNSLSDAELTKLASDLNTTKTKTQIDLLHKDLRFPTLLTKSAVIERIRATETKDGFESVNINYKLNNNYDLDLTFTNDNYNYHSAKAKEVKLDNGLVAYVEVMKDDMGETAYITWKEKELQYHLQLSSNVPLKDIVKENKITEEDLVKIAKSFK